jgi:hypothetical protein
MKLDDAQKQKVREWIEAGLSLSDIQNKLSAELEIRMTYMEVRFLVDDLGVKLKDKPVESAPPEFKPSPAASEGKEKPAQATKEPGRAGGVTVVVDQVMRPGALVSGKVTFSDGKTADWYLDQMGRLGLVPKEKDYKPSQEDVMEFQTELQGELARQGF